MFRTLKRAILWVRAALMAVALAMATLIAWPDPLFAFSLGSGKIVVAADRPIDVTGGERFLRDCETLLERSPLKAESRQYHVYVTNADWRHRLFFLMRSKPLGLTYYYGFGGSAFLGGANFDTGRIVHWRYVAPPPRTLAFFCAHELTHVVTGEHVGMAAFLRMPNWVREGFADYVAFAPRQPFEQLRGALGERPVDDRMMQTYGSYPRYRLLVTYFLEKRNWSVEQLLATRLSEDEALAMMRADAS
jgi:hypothetical protein